MNIHSSTINGSFDLPISFRHFKVNEKNSDLVIMLPGQGYSTQSPIFHYATGIYLKGSYDVLHVNYDYRKSEYKNLNFDEVANAVQYDAKVVIEKVLQENSYQNYIVLGKSLGTIAMASIISIEELKTAKFLWLTPLLQRGYVCEAMLQSGQKALNIIGDHDHCYVEERFLQLAEKENMKSILIPGVDHSLEYGDDVPGSLDVLKEVLQKMKEFSEE